MLKIKYSHIEKDIDYNEYVEALIIVESFFDNLIKDIPKDDPDIQKIIVAFDIVKAFGKKHNPE